MDVLDNFPLGDGMFLLIIQLSNQIEIYIGPWKKNLVQQEMFTLSPLEWYHVAHNSYPTHRQPIIINDSVMFSTKRNSDDVVLQKYHTNSNYERHFLLPICILNKTQWENIIYESKIFTECVLEYLFKNFTNTLCLMASREYETDPTIESKLLTSLIEMLCEALTLSIKDQLQCDGCFHAYGNQEAHQCMYFTRKQLLDRYGDVAFCGIDYQKVAREFFQKFTMVKLHESICVE
ncbi:hypothetical protein TNIN_47481 [Trichonephila inaurata madagascariensis]|uniref:Uncharacterized protein n=1 Tax=Trichonephila inaurata madagascariensis TaxID=2747483 RepID=A0A8X6Y4D6_9ARAC|nr:hypothetical protein TNIN_47481 [Trichonephila inaurata madagascariensis]